MHIITFSQREAVLHFRPQGSVWEVLCGFLSCYCWRLLCLLCIEVHTRDVRGWGSHFEFSFNFFFFLNKFCFGWTDNTRRRAYAFSFFTWIYSFEHWGLTTLEFNTFSVTLDTVWRNTVHVFFWSSSPQKLQLVTSNTKETSSSEIDIYFQDCW